MKTRPIGFVLAVRSTLGDEDACHETIYTGESIPVRCIRLSFATASPAWWTVPLGSSRRYSWLATFPAPPRRFVPRNWGGKFYLSPPSRDVNSTHESLHFNILIHFLKLIRFIFKIQNKVESILNFVKCVSIRDIKDWLSCSYIIMQSLAVLIFIMSFKTILISKLTMEIFFFRQYRYVECI